MSRNNSAQGFSVLQPSLGAPLQWNPALGTRELDDLINAYVPGSAPISEKRAVVSMDFFEYSQTTGASFRYYPVPSMSFNAATSSAASSPMQDSGYASSFVSPALSDWSWPASVAPSTPSSLFQETSAPLAITGTSKKTSSLTTGTSGPDFSSWPGMKIMTRDGRDVTSSASRGCKTKEQRDHAHLMRVLKACDACKKKKVRCDPSHKKRVSAAASQAPSQSSSKSRLSAKKGKQPVKEPQPSLPQAAPPLAGPSMPAATALPDLNVELVDILAGNEQDPWDAFVQYEDEPMDAILPDWDLFLEPPGNFSSAFAQAISPVPAQDYTHAPSRAFSGPPPGRTFDEEYSPHRPDTQAPMLPYVGAGGSGIDYVDFDLFSPAASFVDDDFMPVNDIGRKTARCARDASLDLDCLHQENDTQAPPLHGPTPPRVDQRGCPLAGVVSRSSSAQPSTLASNWTGQAVLLGDFDAPNASAVPDTYLSNNLTAAHDGRSQWYYAPLRPTPDTQESSTSVRHGNTEYRGAKLTKWKGEISLASPVSMTHAPQNTISQSTARHSTAVGSGREVYDCTRGAGIERIRDKRANSAAFADELQQLTPRRLAVLDSDFLSTLGASTLPVRRDTNDKAQPAQHGAAPEERTAGWHRCVHQSSGSDGCSISRGTAIATNSRTKHSAMGACTAKDVQQGLQAENDTRLSHDVGPLLTAPRGGNACRAILATFVLGALAIAGPLATAAAIIQAALVLLILGTACLPETFTSKGTFSGQRTHGITSSSISRNLRQVHGSAMRNQGTRGLLALVQGIM